MKKVIGMLALLAFVGNVASAELLKNFKADGKIEVNAYQVNNAADYNKDAADKKNDVDTRVQINAGFDLNEDANAVVSVVKNDRQYGSASQDANTITTKLFFEQAYINLKGVLGFDHKLGRQYYGNEGDLMVFYGPTAWPYQSVRNVALQSMPVSALDGYTGWYKTGKWDIHGVLANAANANVAADNDQDLFGLVAKYDLGKEYVNPSAYYYRYTTQAGTGFAGPNDHLDVVGVKSNGKYMGFDYNAEFAMNMGQNNDAVNTTGLAAAGTNKYQGYGFMANVKYGLDLAGKLDLMAEYAMGSGDKKATDDKVKAFYSINSDYRPGVIYGGFYTNAGITNLTTYNVGAMWMPSSIEKLSIGAKYYNFAETEKLGGKSNIGTEMDLCVNWKHSENVNVKAYAASFTPEKDTVPAVTTDDAATMLGAAFSVKF